MSSSKPFIVLCVALGVLGAASAAVAGGHKAKAVPVSAPAGASYAAALVSVMVPHKVTGWDHNYQSWCDVDPNCNGWTQRMQTYEGRK